MSARPSRTLQSPWRLQHPLLDLTVRKVDHRNISAGVEERLGADSDIPVDSRLRRRSSFNRLDSSRRTASTAGMLRRHNTEQLFPFSSDERQPLGRRWISSSKNSVCNDCRLIDRRFTQHHLVHLGGCDTKRHGLDLSSPCRGAAPFLPAARAVRALRIDESTWPAWSLASLGQQCTFEQFSRFDPFATSSATTSAEISSGTIRRPLEARRWTRSASNQKISG